MSKLKQISIDVDVHRAIEGARRNFRESENEILRRLLVCTSEILEDSTKYTAPTPRSRGQWTVRIDGDACSAINLKDAYCKFILGLADYDATFLAKFAEQKSSARRFVARNAEDLYLKSPHLAREHGAKLKTGWFIDTNLSEEQVAKRIRIAAQITGLLYGPQTCLLQDLKQL